MASYDFNHPQTFLTFFKNWAMNIVKHGNGESAYRFLETKTCKIFKQFESLNILALFLGISHKFKTSSSQWRFSMSYSLFEILSCSNPTIASVGDLLCAIYKLKDHKLRAKNLFLSEFLPIYWSMFMLCLLS